MHSLVAVFVASLVGFVTTQTIDPDSVPKDLRSTSDVVANSPLELVWNITDVSRQLVPGSNHVMPTHLPPDAGKF
jgi:hypothetical protein